MRITELTLEEKAFLNGALCVAVPFVVRYSPAGDAGKRLEIEVYPSLRRTAEEFAALFGDSEESLFSDTAAEWAKEHLGGFLTERGYEISDDTDGVYLNYRLDTADAGQILGSSVRLHDCAGLENLTGYDIEALTAFGHICYATVIDGRILSAATTNIPLEAIDCDEPVEIGVETAGEYRRMGYGASNVAALINELGGMGYTSVYECEASNTPSAKLIERLGGTECVKIFYLVGMPAEE